MVSTILKRNFRLILKIDNVDECFNNQDYPEINFVDIVNKLGYKKWVCCKNTVRVKNYYEIIQLVIMIVICCYYGL